MTFRSLTQVTLPLESLRELEDSIQLDQDVLSDVKAAMVELSARIQHRTSILASMLQDVSGGTQRLHEGCKVLESRVDQMAGMIQEQQLCLEQLREQTVGEIRMVQQRLEAQSSISDSLSSRVQQLEGTTTLQAEAIAAAKFEQLHGKFEQLAEHLDRRVNSLEDQMQRAQLVSSHLQTSLERAVKDAEESGQETDLVSRIQTHMVETLQRTEALSSHVESELRLLHERVGEVAEKAVVDSQTCEQRTRQIESCLEQIREEIHECGSKESGPVIHEMSPDQQGQSDPAQAEEDWWCGGNENAWTEWNEQTEANPENPWNWSWSAPPGLPPEFMRAPPVADESVPHGRWKLLLDVPAFTVGGGEAWECNMRLQTWWKQLETVASTVSPRFGTFVHEQYTLAEKRHRRRLEGFFDDQELEKISSDCQEYENRLTLTLIRCLPTELKQPVLEKTGQQQLRSIHLIECVLQEQMPGGQQEMKSIQAFVRHLDPAHTAKEGLETLRRWKLARTRARDLQLPAVAPFEEIQALSSLIKTLERKSEAFRTLMGLLRVQPDVLRPSAQGVESMIRLIEQQLQILSADETIKYNRQAGQTDASIAAKGKGKGKDKDGKGKGKDKNGKGKGKDKDGKGKSKDTKPDDTTKRSNKPCRFYFTPAGCYRKHCTFSHDEKFRKEMEASAAAAAAAPPREPLVGTENSSSGNAAAAASKPNGKPKGKAKASAVKAFAFMAQCYEPLEEPEPGGLHHAPLDDLWLLRLNPEEYLQWRQQLSPNWVRAHASRSFVRITTPNSIAECIVLAASEFENELPTEDIEISATQRLIRLERVFVRCADGAARAAYMGWAIDLETENEVFAVALTSASRCPQQRPEVRWGQFKIPPRAAYTPLQLADGQEVEAWRNRDGEILIRGGPESSSTICGICKLIRIGCAFLWEEHGAWLRFPKELGSTWYELEVIAGLPYLEWETYKQLRPLITQKWKSVRTTCRATTVEENSQSEGQQSEAMKIQIANPMDQIRIEAECSEESKAMVIDEVTQAGEQQAAELLAKGDSHITCSTVLRLIEKINLPLQRHRRSNADSEDASGGVIPMWTLGLWTHGQKRGLSRMCMQRPMLTKVLCKLMNKIAPGVQFTTIVLARNVTFKPHRDSQNQKGSKNTIVCLNSSLQCKGGELWVQSKDGNDVREVRPGLEVAGEAHDICRKPFTFSPFVWHGTCSWEGVRTVLTAYTPHGMSNASEEEQTMLMEMGFPVTSAKQQHSQEAPQHQSQKATSVPEQSESSLSPPSVSVDQGFQGNSGDGQGTFEGVIFLEVFRV
ncbi:GIP [Symbiodinium sp. CCMP2592]|nr:GIP [Symbiodinium sp. CCMP2592]